MLTDSEVRSRLRDALEAVTPPAPWLASRIQEAVEAQPRNGWSRRTARGPRVSLRIVAAAVLIILVAAAVATFLVAHYPFPSTVPASPSSSSSSRGWANGGIAMVTATDGWGNGVPFTHTTDGGLHWKDVTPLGVGRHFDSYYLDATHAWVTDFSGGCSLVLPGSHCLVPIEFTTYRTADGGRTWQRGSPTTIGVATVGLPDREFYFLDPDHGWLRVSIQRIANGVPVYSDNLYRTNDRGLHWAIEAVHPAPVSWSPEKFSCYEWCGPMAFGSATTGWLWTVLASDPTKHRVLVTHDGGGTWSEQTLPLDSANMGCPCWPGQVVLDDLHVVFELISLPSERATLLVTPDGGVTWAAHALPGTAQVDVGFYDFKHGWVIEAAQTTLATWSPTSPAIPLALDRTDDGGSTWTRIRTDLQLASNGGEVGSVYFVDQEIGFAIRDIGTAATPVGCYLPSGFCNTVRELLKTSDGGHTWSVVNANI
jgi:hypothetical protein